MRSLLQLQPLAIALLGAATLGGCANTGPGSLGDTISLRREIVWFYERNAWERSASCLQPKMSISDMRLIEETDERLVFDVRYFYDDPSYGRRSRGSFGVPGNYCFGTGQRTFVVIKRQGGGYTVGSMTGPQRG